jgi:hypothetical protein
MEFASAVIKLMAGGTHKIREGGAHLPLSQWQGPAISFMAADVNPYLMYLDSLNIKIASETYFHR